jgi:hypothetical protein
VVAAVPVWAHHSHGNYEMSEFVTLQGVVKELHLLNPHAWVYVEVKDASGKPVLWALEATSPGGLRTNGVKREDVQPGDEVKIRCHKLRDGSPGCLLGFLTPNHGDPARGHGIEKEWD